MKKIAVFAVVSFIILVVFAQIKFENTVSKISGMSEGHSLHVLQTAGYDVESVHDRVSITMKISALFHGD